MSTPADLPEPAAIVASIIHLMTRHAGSGCPRLGELVIRQLEFLERHPSGEVTPMLRHVCRSLIVDWHRLLSHFDASRPAGAPRTVH